MKSLVRSGAESIGYLDTFPWNNRLRVFPSEVAYRGGCERDSLIDVNAVFLRDALNLSSLYLEDRIACLAT